MSPSELESMTLRMLDGELPADEVAALETELLANVESREAYRRLIAAKPAFLIFVDVRYPGSVPLADGMFPAYTHAIGSVPTVNAAFQDAWAWRQSGADAARLTVVGGMRRSESQNVIAELPGSEPDSGIVEYIFDYNSFLAGKAPGTNMVLQPGDHVVVPD